MPSVKQGGGFTLTFSKKNQDVKEHLDKLKENKVIITDYLCEAVRFFESNKNINANNISHLDIDNIIDEKIKALVCNISLDINKETISEKVDNNEDISKEYDNSNLEDGLDSIPDSDIEED